MYSKTILTSCLLVLLWALPAQALEVVQTQWGFDGQAVAGEFNLLSVQVYNDSDRPFQGELGLSKSAGLGRLGIELIEPIYLPPRATRWVQFTPVVKNAHDTFRLSWGRGGSDTLPELRLGGPAAVLIGAAAWGNTRQAVRHFPAELFPSTLAATDTLGVVLLDETPQWDAPRRSVLLDWVRAGGTLHLLRGSSGHPTFEGDWSALDQPLDSYRVGAGLVTKHDLSRHDLDSATAERLGAQTRQAESSPNMYSGEEFNMLNQLRQMVRPKHNWALLYWLSGLYLVVLGPVNLFMAKRRIKVRYSVAMLAALVSLFGVMFFAVGKRGYDEQSTIHTLSYARPLADDLHDVTQWGNLFVTRGDQYTVEHDSIDSTYATWFDQEAVRGVVHNGRQGMMLLDIPLYSSREMVHRGRMRGHDLSVEVADWQFDRGGLSLTLNTPDEFPPAESVLEMWAHYGDSLVPLQREADGTLRTGVSRSTLATHQSQFTNGSWPYGGPGIPLADLSKRLIARAINPTRTGFGDGDDADVRVTRPDGENHVQLLILAETPPGMSIASEGLGRETGYVLYHLDLYKEQQVAEQLNDATPALVIKNLSHRFKKHQALDRVSFTVPSGCIHGFVGPNGAGKTTTLKAVATLMPPQTGSVQVYGRDVVRDKKRVRQHIGFMPDHFSMYRQMTVWEYLDFFAAAYGLPLAKRERVVQDVLALTDMAGRRDDLIKGLSRGMQQRVSLARVLVSDPKLLLLDEPASGLDPRIELMEILQELRRMGKTIFISSHILSELATLCDSVTIIDRGQIRYSGSMAGLLVADGDEAAYILTLDAETVGMLEALQSLPTVKAAPVEGPVPAYRIQFDQAITDASAILRRVMDSGGVVAGFARDQKHLNQAFMDLTSPGVRS